MFLQTSPSLSCLLLVFAAYASYGVPARTDNDVDPMKQLVAWLPLETESLVVAKAYYKDFRFDVDRIIERGHFAPATPYGVKGAVHLIRNGTYIQELSDQDVRFAAHASCRFRLSKAPRGGPTHYAGCHIVWFENDITTVANRLMQTMEKDADGSFEARGRTVLTFKERYRDEEWLFLVTFPVPNVLVIGTDEKYLRALIERIDETPTTTFLKDKRLQSALPYDSSFWAVRQYREDVPLSVPRSSVGFVFRVTNEWKEAFGEFIIAEDIRAETVRDLWRYFPPDSRAPIVTQVGNGILQIHYKLEDEESIKFFLGRLGWNLGDGEG